MMTLRSKPEQGFTLVELLVALFISAILFTMGYGSLRQAIGNRGEVEEQAQRLTDVQQTFRIMEQDFELIQPRPVRDVLGSGYLNPVVFNPNALSGSSSKSTSTSTSTSISLSEALLSVTRGGWANYAGLPRSELQRVGYLVRDGVLIRQHLPVLDTTAATAPEERALLKQVESLSFRFMDDTLVWRPAWPTPNVLPQPPQFQWRARPVAIEITLKLKDFGELVRIVEVAG